MINGFSRTETWTRPAPPASPPRPCNSRRTRTCPRLRDCRSSFLHFELCPKRSFCPRRHCRDTDISSRERKATPRPASSWKHCSEHIHHNQVTYYHKEPSRRACRKTLRKQAPCGWKGQSLSARTCQGWKHRSWSISWSWKT